MEILTSVLLLFSIIGRRWLVIHSNQAQTYLKLRNRIFRILKQNIKNLMKEEKV